MYICGLGLVISPLWTWDLSFTFEYWMASQVFKVSPLRVLWRCQPGGGGGGWGRTYLVETLPFQPGYHLSIICFRYQAALKVSFTKRALMLQKHWKLLKCVQCQSFPHSGSWKCSIGFLNVTSHFLRRVKVPGIKWWLLGAASIQISRSLTPKGPGVKHSHIHGIKDILKFICFSQKTTGTGLRQACQWIVLHFTTVRDFA